VDHYKVKKSYMSNKLKIGSGRSYLDYKRRCYVLFTKSLVFLFIRAPDLGFLKPLCSKSQFFVFDPARKIRDPKKNRPPFLQETLIHLLKFINNQRDWVGHSLNPKLLLN